MKNREILKAILEKGIDQGYKVNQASFDYLMNLLRKDDKTCRSALDYYIGENKYYDTIFSHNFAKAFWGTKVWTKPDLHSDYEEVRFNNGIAMKNYEYHLQQMVLEEEPLKYMEKFL